MSSLKAPFYIFLATFSAVSACNFTNRAILTFGQSVDSIKVIEAKGVEVR